MQHIKLRDLDVSRIGLGAMGMSDSYTGAGSDEAESIRTIHRALDLGVTFLDTAEFYGPYLNEELVGRALKSRRDQVVLATKFGLVSHTGGTATANAVDEILPLVRGLGIGSVPYSPLGHGFPTGTVRSIERLDPSDFRVDNPRFTGENFQRNLAIADEVEAVAAQAEATPAQVALAWLLAKGEDIAPIPGTKRVSRVEENTAADRVALSTEQLTRLDGLAPPSATASRRNSGSSSTTDRSPRRPRTHRRSGQKGATPCRRNRPPRRSPSATSRPSSPI